MASDKKDHAFLKEDLEGLEFQTVEVEEEEEGSASVEVEERSPEKENSYVRPLRSSERGCGTRSEEDEEAAGSNLWLITFTDAMALMLTFFVLLYSMSTPDVEKWRDVTRGISAGISKFAGASRFAGNQDTISINKISAKKGLNLNYLEALLKEAIAGNEALADVVLLKRSDRLILSLPSMQIFDDAQDDHLSPKGKRALFAVAELVMRIRNRIEVAGHASVDMDVSFPAQSHRELSLMRASQVTAALKVLGYDRPIIARGLADERLKTLDPNLTAEQRKMLSQRVDVVILRDGGDLSNVFIK